MNSTDFSAVLPQEKPVAIGGISIEELDAELRKGVESLNGGKRISAEEVDRGLARNFGL